MVVFIHSSHLAVQGLWHSCVTESLCKGVPRSHHVLDSLLLFHREREREKKKAREIPLMPELRDKPGLCPYQMRLARIAADQVIIFRGLVKHTVSSVLA